MQQNIFIWTQQKEHCVYIQEYLLIRAIPIVCYLPGYTQSDGNLYKLTPYFLIYSGFMFNNSLYIGNMAKHPEPSFPPVYSRLSPWRDDFAALYQNYCRLSL